MSATDLATLNAWRASLEKAIFSGVRTVRYSHASGEHETTYHSLAEMRAALADLDRRIATASGATPVRTIRLSTSKGV